MLRKLSLKAFMKLKEKRRRLKNKTEKPFMKRIPAKKAASDENLRRRRQKSSLRRT